MKQKLSVYLILFLLLTALPMIPACVISPAASAQQQDTAASEENTEAETETEYNAENTSDTKYYYILDTETEEVSEVSVRDYLIGAVGAEMPVSFETEALKAQAVAAHTYAERQALFAEQRSDLQGADFSDDPNQYQAFYTKAELKTLYGDNFDAYYEKLENAVDAVLSEILVYDDQPIIAAFHAISTGKTESAANVWGNDVAYLQSVDSSGDLQAPRYEQSVSYTPQQVQELLESARTGLILGTDTAHWFGEPSYSDAGTVMQIAVGTSIFTGQELRELFSLRSAAFSISYEDNQFIFTTKGYGHIVGMSQYGANAMALQGYSYQEILAYYYPETSLVSVS